MSSPFISRLSDRDITSRRSAAGDGPLAGIAFAVKDNIDVAGLPTTAGCKAFSKMPAADSPVVKRLRDVGAIVGEVWALRTA